MERSTARTGLDGDARSTSTPCKRSRDDGGVFVTVPEFALTRAIVFRSDNNPTGFLVRLQDTARRMRKLATQWAVTLAQVEIDKVLRVEEELERAGHSPPDPAQLAAQARERLA